MITQCLRRAFRCHGSGIAVVAAPLAVIGALGLWAGADFGAVFMLASLGSLLVFMAIGSKCPANQASCPDCC